MKRGNTVDMNREYIEKRNEILDAAEILFTAKGYEKCSVNNILEKVGIAKGTFYYYFKSKEEVLDSIIDRVTQMVFKRVEAIAEDKNLSSKEKLIKAILSMRVESDRDNDFMTRIHKPENALTHQKSLRLMLVTITPILDKIVEEGISRGSFKSDFPKQYLQIFLTSTMTLLDDGIFKTSPQEQQKIIRALVSLLEKMLGVRDREFWDMVEVYYS
nr:TetR/AcrR family transcriptional regulator [Tissierella sp.]